MGEEEQIAFKEPRGRAEPAPTRKAGSAYIFQVRSGKSLGVQGRSSVSELANAWLTCSILLAEAPSVTLPPCSLLNRAGEQHVSRKAPPPIQWAAANPTLVPQRKSLRGLLGSGALC